jgi:DNA-binding MarR family transcriptional regulator|tara:strand:- start:108877 stop:109323 length:447 start_codon:yes stop_codon:yes gene_type:complete
MNENLGFLISDVGRLLRRRFDADASTLGVTRAQWRVLLSLSREEGIKQASLAERLEVEPISLCRMVDRLAEASLVERRRDPNDRRAWLIYLKEPARPLIDQLRDVGTGVSAAATSSLSADEIEQLGHLLNKVRDGLTSPASEGKRAHG